MLINITWRIHRIRGMQLRLFKWIILSCKQQRAAFFYFRSASKMKMPKITIRLNWHSWACRKKVNWIRRWASCGLSITSRFIHEPQLVCDGRKNEELWTGNGVGKIATLFATRFWQSILGVARCAQFESTKCSLHWCASIGAAAANAGIGIQRNRTEHATAKYDCVATSYGMRLCKNQLFRCLHSRRHRVSNDCRQLQREYCRKWQNVVDKHAQIGSVHAHRSAQQWY